jgi:hypothetical protein
MWTFIYSILKQFGVHLVTKNIKETFVYTRTTGKILDVNLTFTSMNTSNVISGKVGKTLRLTKTAVDLSIDAK